MPLDFEASLQRTSQFSGSPTAWIDLAVGTADPDGLVLFSDTNAPLAILLPGQATVNQKCQRLFRARQRSFSLSSSGAEGRGEESVLSGALFIFGMFQETR